MLSCNINDKVRVIWKSSDEHIHCRRGTVLNVEEDSIEIEYANSDSILGKTNIVKILKHEILSILKYE